MDRTKQKEKQTLYIEKEQILRLRQVRERIYEKYNKKYPLNHFLKEAIDEYLEVNFPKREELNEELNQQIQVYLSKIKTLQERIKNE